MTKYQSLSVVTVFATVVMIAVGSTVRSTGSGLGCPDWPLCYGGIFPPLEFAAIIEWVHRFIATVISVLVGLEVLGAIRQRHADPALWKLNLLSGVLLVFQAVLGGVTVLTGNAPWTVFAHLAAALTFLGVVTMIAALAFLGPNRLPIMTAERAAFIRSARNTMLVMALVLAIGAYTVATDAGFACTSWPGCPEGQIPFGSGGPLQHINWTHRFTVAGGLAVVVWLFLKVREMRHAGRMLQRGAHSLIGLYGLQILIGALNPLTGYSHPAKVGHLAVAALIWVVMILMWYAARFSVERTAEDTSNTPRGARSARA